MKKILYIILTAVAALLPGIREAVAQVKLAPGVEMDRDVHDFGDLILGSGPVNCTFTLSNNSDKPVAIYNVVSSCGCTDVVWTKEPVKPGEQARISATYSNNEAPVPFDKNLTVYLSCSKKPVILKLRGVCHSRPLSLAEIYSHRFGDLGFRSLDVKCGNILQGESRSGEFKMANLGTSPVRVRFADLSDGLEIRTEESVIEPGAEVSVTYTISSSRSRWGGNSYYATPVVDGRSSFELGGLPDGAKAGKLRITAFTTDNFSSLTDEQKSRGPRPVFKTSTFSFGKMKAGETIHAEFSFTNEGEECFCVYRCETDALRYSHGRIEPVRSGEDGSVRVHVDSSMMPKGETLVTVKLTTNSPLRPVINLFITGYLE
ncbi:MAG: DUF1573 domain-containing protein [Candidatus Cryptobacteroides sp.]